MDANATQLFANFSQMALTTKLSGPLPESDFSYVVVGKPMVGSLRYFEVNFTEGPVGSIFSSTFTAWFAPNGTATNVSEPEYQLDWTGLNASERGASLAAAYLVELESNSIAGSIATSPAFGSLGWGTTPLGPTMVNETIYELKSVPLNLCGEAITYLIEDVGTVPGTGFPLVFSTYVQFSSQGISGSISSKVMSLTVASP